jgi:dTDP-4-amino-4,6-dideoxy-D-galactose acyltransferase
VTEAVANGAVEHLDWDTAHFGMPIGRARKPDSPERILAAVEAADRAGLRCLTALVDAGFTGSISAAEREGFRCYDVRTELDRAVQADAAHKQGVRMADEDDMRALEPIARRRFTLSRFYADPNFPEGRVEALYAAWLRRGLSDDNRFVLTTSECDGFVVCHVDSRSRVGTIELIAVAERSEGEGRGGRLVDAAEGEFGVKGLTRFRVITQGANLAAQRLYQGRGLRTAAVGLWLHRWAPSPGLDLVFK